MELIGDVARKHGPADRLEAEVTKTTCAAKVAARTGRFHVPPVVGFDARAGVLDTERVHGFLSLMQLVSRRDARLPGICERVGRAIADVHAELRLPDTLRIPLPAPLVGEPADECVLHGDLNGSNVGYDPSRDRIVILDWSTAPALRSVATTGSRYFDILWFALFFFRFRPRSALLHWSPELWAGSFLRGYAAGSDAFTVEALRAYHESIRAFLSDDYRLERERLGRGVRSVPYFVWQWVGWRRWEKFLASSSDSPRIESCAASSES